MAKLVSNTYGEALFELAVEENKVDALDAQIKTIRQAFEQNEDLIKLLTHPQITKEEKKNVVENIFKGRADEDIVGFLLIVVEKGRADELISIFDFFLDKVKEYKKIGVAYVTSAVELNDSLKKKIETKLLSQTGFKSIEMHYSTDAELIGGFVIRIGDRVVDSSIRTKLTSLSKNLGKIQLGS